MKTLDAEHYLLGISLRKDRVSSFDDYPYCLPVCRHMGMLNLHPAVTFLVGENGTGKSTLLEAVAVAAGFNSEGGTKNFGFSTRASHSSLYNSITLQRSLKKPQDGFFLRAESFFNVATEIERLDSEPAFAPPLIDSYGGKSLHEQSHGESFLSLVMERFGGDGLYILDEPEAALSPTRQLALLSRIHDLVHQRSQFIIATHSPILMAYPNAYIYQLTDDAVNRIPYTDTEHYAVTKEFLNKHEAMLESLLERNEG